VLARFLSPLMNGPPTHPVVHHPTYTITTAFAHSTFARE
jgi:hypothetical protein